MWSVWIYIWSMERWNLCTKIAQGECDKYDCMNPIPIVFVFCTKHILMEATMVSCMRNHHVFFVLVYVCCCLRSDYENDDDGDDDDDDDDELLIV